MSKVIQLSSFVSSQRKNKTMLYVNVFLVRQVYGGAEEGGWYFDAGTPLASIPVDTDYKPGQCYTIEEGIHVSECPACVGTPGEVEEDPNSDEPRMVRCTECGLIPDDLEGTWKLIQKYQEFFKDQAGRGEEILVHLNEGFARPFPDRRPTYE